MPSTMMVAFFLNFTPRFHFRCIWTVAKPNGTAHWVSNWMAFIQENFSSTAQETMSHNIECIHTCILLMVYIYVECGNNFECTTISHMLFSIPLARSFAPSLCRLLFPNVVSLSHIYTVNCMCVCVRLSSTSSTNTRA